MSSLFLREDLDPAAVAASGIASVTGAEAKHAVTVNRTRLGERVSIGNGRGLIVTGPVVTADAGELAIQAELVENVQPASPRLVLVQALAKGGRDEMAVQASTELGVDAVIPWSAARSVSRWEGAKVAKGQDRWASIVREASKQSIRAWLPDVTALFSTKDLERLAATSRMLVLEPTAELALTEWTAAELGRAGHSSGHNPELDIVLVVGPEGGIAPNELERLQAAGASLVRLGSTVLRTSTAGAAALSVLSAHLGRW
ncbi:16S rRNA (uracil(1498)-N(3))-methyltransferase [Microterricola pindariensis]|uniref:Ribosomal RNA small subunit methyltransferase E n=1 Tax=Microterricola pindariensis TaxID=478010 RepID=A0ABX5AUU0_9MICO|nr:16S rRNA (uracil(1498)-N(3))-methyltransferase [Microterricola pindariensis]PPL18673.1 16S rRNA (uracil(1498)-N(3))-methyltransferase [Microterricola pindariensis]